MTDHSAGFFFSWTLKTTHTYASQVTILGQRDFFCVEFGAQHLFFPMFDGVAWGDPPA